MTQVPGYWMYEVSGRLRAAIEAYLRNDPLNAEQIATIRAYFRQWISADVWVDFDRKIANLRASVDAIQTRRDIDEWLNAAEAAWIDPL